MNNFVASDKLPQSIFMNTLKDDFSFTDPLKINDVVEPVNNYRRKLVSGIKELQQAIPQLSDKLNLPNSVLSKLSDSDIRNLPDSVIDKLSDIDIRNLSGSVISKLSDSDIRNLPGSVISKLSDIDKLKLPDSVIDKFDKFSKSTAKLDAGNLLDRIPGLSENVKRSLLNGDVISSIQRAGGVDDYINIAGRVFEVPPGGMGMVRSLHEVVKMIENKTLMSTLTENLKSSLIGIGLDVAGHYGYRDLAEYLIDRLDQPSYKHMAWGQAIYSYGSSSELDVVLQAIRNGGLTGIYSLTEDPVGHILGSFRFNLDRHGSVSKNMEILIEILDLLDPEWLKYRRGDVTIYKLCNLRKASQDAINGFDSIEEIRPFARSSKVLRPMGTRAIMKSTYPILEALM